jgi:multiple sugar transport system substrate-binding protein
MSGSSILVTLNALRVKGGEAQAGHLFDRKGTPMKDDILHSPLPRGAGGEFGYHLPMSNMVMGCSKNQKAAKDFLRWITSNDVYQAGSTPSRAIRSVRPQCGKTIRYGSETPSCCPSDPLRAAGRFPGYAGPADRHAAEVLRKYIIIDMYAKAVQSVPVEDAVKSAHEAVQAVHAPT